MIETTVMLVEIIAFAIVGLHLIAKLVVNKPDNRIRAGFEKILIAVIMIGFCCLIYIFVEGTYHATWSSYLLIALAIILLLVLRGKYLRDTKEAVKQL